MQRAHAHRSGRAAIIVASKATLCTRLDPFIQQGESALELRTAIILFAHLAKGRGWLFDQIVAGLRGTPCYPDSGTDADFRARRTRYRPAMDLLLAAFLRA